jgi:hypothetical protein
MAEAQSRTIAPLPDDELLLAKRATDDETSCGLARHGP